MSQDKPIIENLIQFRNLPEQLKEGAMKKALHAGYKRDEKATQHLWFNVQNNQLADGMIDKGIMKDTLKQTA